MKAALRERMARPLPDVSRLQQLFSLRDGILIWRERPCSDFQTRDRWLTFNRRYAKNAAGWRDARGYLQVWADGKKYWAHRIIFALANGAVPLETEIVDHIDGNPNNNQPSNLRLADQSKNVSNGKRRKTNRVGFKGVQPSPTVGKFTAQITVKGVTYHLGTFLTAEDAHHAYVDASHKLHGDFGRGA